MPITNNKYFPKFYLIASRSEKIYQSIIPKLNFLVAQNEDDSEWVSLKDTLIKPGEPFSADHG